jgi:hypothetical protein
MKLSHPVLIAFGLMSGALILPVAVRAQSASPEPSATPSVSAPASTDTAAAGQGEHAAKHAGKMAALTPEERAELKAAHEKALQDPAVKAAEPQKSTDHRAYEKAVHEAMIRADPGVRAILQKMHPRGNHAANANANAAQ